MLIMKMHTCKKVVIKPILCNIYIKEEIEEIVEVCNYMYSNCLHGILQFTYACTIFIGACVHAYMCVHACMLTCSLLLNCFLTLEKYSLFQSCSTKQDLSKELNTMSSLFMDKELLQLPSDS